MKRLKDSMMEFLTHAEIQELVRRLAKEIEIDYAGKEIVFICPLKGSLLFMADLCRAVELPQQIDFVHVSAIERKGTIRMIKDLSVNIGNKHVIIVEEVVDTARTLTFLKHRILSSSPASLKIVALLDKPARRELPIRPDYIGKTIDDRYVVGYGMDSDEIGRNYKDVFYFKQ